MKLENQTLHTNLFITQSNTHKTKLTILGKEKVKGLISVLVFFVSVQNYKLPNPNLNFPSVNFSGNTQQTELKTKFNKGKITQFSL